MIYFIQDTSSKAIKIGVSKKPTQRLSDLQTAHATKLVLLAVMDGGQREERELHLRFTRKQGEWFEPRPDLLRFIGAEAMSLASLDTATAELWPTSLIERLYVLRDTALVLLMWATIVAFLYYAARTIAIAAVVAPDAWSAGRAVASLLLAIMAKYAADFVAAPYRTRKTS